VVDGFWTGFGAAFAVVGAVAACIGLVWLTLILLPEVTWWTVKRLPLMSPIRRDVSAGVVGGARRAYCLRIPFGVRIIVALGGTRDEHEDYAALIGVGRAVEAERGRRD
jgi:hypothetical protein